MLVSVPQKFHHRKVTMKAGTRMNKYHTASECGNHDLQDYFLTIIVLISSICSSTQWLEEDRGRLGRVGVAGVD